MLSCTVIMKNKQTLACLVLALLASSGLSQCTIYDNWLENRHRARNPIIVEPLPQPVASATPTTAPPVPQMPVVKPLSGRLLSEQVFEVDGRKFLQQRIVIRESPLETELRVTQIP